MAELIFKYGAMNSGKSTALINAAYNFEEQGLNVLVTKPGIDTKGESSVVARAAGLERRVDFITHVDTNIREEVAEHTRRFSDARRKRINALLVDEAQFLMSEQVDQLLEVAKLDKTTVITYGLRTDYQRHMFEGTKRLFELADTFEKLRTMCRCGKEAEFNVRRQNGLYVFSGEQIAIDGENEITYDSKCGKCYLEAEAKAYNALKR